MKSIHTFFTDYIAASLAGNAGELAKFYADQFMVATKDASKAFNNDAVFIDWLNGVFKFNQQSGLQTMKVKRVDVQPVGEYFVQASVVWSTTFAKKPGHEISFDIHYLLNCARDEPKIILYISEEDQEELMKKEGLL